MNAHDYMGRLFIFDDDFGEEYDEEYDEEYVPHPSRCMCDECVAARSDEYYSRKLDNELMEE